MRILIRAGVVVAASSAALLLSSVAHATTDTYTVPLHQAKDLPLTATSWTGDKEKSCAGVPADRDGWHFVLPGNSTDFVKLTVDFKEGGEQVIKAFGPPSDKHAYVSSAPGDELLSASAEVKGGEVKWFNLSHTCPASEDSPTPGGGSSTPSDNSSTPSDDSSTPSGNSSTPSGDDTASPTATASESSAVTPTSSPSAPGGDLAETGNGAPVGALSAVAGVLVAAGGFLVFRRRKAAQRG